MTRNATPFAAKPLVLVVFLLLGWARAGWAQAPRPVGPPTAARPAAPDSLRRAVQRAFKWGRRFSFVGGISGGLVAGSGIGYALNGDRSWQPKINIALGSTAFATGLAGWVQFSRRRERRALQALDQGLPLPPDAVAALALLPDFVKK